MGANRARVWFSDYAKAEARKENYGPINAELESLLLARDVDYEWLIDKPRYDKYIAEREARSYTVHAYDPFQRGKGVIWRDASGLHLEGYPDWEARIYAFTDTGGLWGDERVWVSLSRSGKREFDPASGDALSGITPIDRLVNGSGSMTRFMWAGIATVASAATLGTIIGPAMATAETGASIAAGSAGAAEAATAATVAAEAAAPAVVAGEVAAGAGGILGTGVTWGEVGTAVLTAGKVAGSVATTVATVARALSSTQQASVAKAQAYNPENDPQKQALFLLGAGSETPANNSPLAGVSPVLLFAAGALVLVLVIKE